MANNFRVLFVYPNQPFLNPPPIGIGVLNAALRQEGFSTDIFDNTFYEYGELTSDKTKEENLQVKPFNFSERGISPIKGDMFEDFSKKVDSFRPNLIAFSTLEGTYPAVLKFLDVIKDKDAKIIVGGVFATMAPEIIIKHPKVSFVCCGEGEKALVQLCKALSEGKDYTKIKNLWVKRGGRVIKNKLSEVMDLNFLPIPDYSIYDEKRFYRPMAGKVYRTVPIETNRGCPFQCTFCNSPTIAEYYRQAKIANYFRKKGIKNIRDELKVLIKRWNAEYVYFASDTFLAMDDKEFDEFVGVYSKFKLPFWIQTRPETVRLDRMKKLKELGCHRMSIGLEHGNEDFRKKILKKKFSNDVFVKASDIIREVGIPLTVNNIIGFPFETRDLIFDTIRLNRRISFDSCNAYSFYPFIGTPLYELCRKESFITEADNSKGCLTKGSRLNMPQLSNEEIRGLMRTFVLYVKMPERLWPQIRIAEKFDEEGNKKFSQLRELYKETYE